MLKLCIECGKKLIGKQRIFCSNKCFGKVRRRKPEYIEQIKKLRKEWEIKNKEKRLAYYREWEHKNYIKRKAKTDRWLLKNKHYHRNYHKKEKAIIRETAYRKTPRAKELQKKIKERFNINHPEYWREIFNKNPEHYRQQHKKYRHSDKGISTFYRIYDSKRRRNSLFLGTKMDTLNLELIKMLKQRDKNCIYCKREFDLSSPKSKGYPSFDHINPELPLIECNAVRCCKYCNSSKRKQEVLSWLKKKGYEPSPILLGLLSKQEEFKKCI